jgi:hypothetical protein
MILDYTMAELSNKRLASYQRRSFLTIKKKLEKMSCDWGDVDNYFESKIGRIAKDIEAMEIEMAEYINES